MSVLLLACVAPAYAAESHGELSNESLFKQAAAAVERGAYEEAIDALELLSDRGFAHPDASFNRGVAYAQRARSPRARPGDLGHAAAGFAETLSLRPLDVQAELALERVRNEISRRLAREGVDSVVARPTIDRALVGLLGENGWAVLSLIGAAALSLGLALRAIKRRGAELSGALSAVVGGCLLLGCATLSYLGQQQRRTSQPGVVVAPLAPLLTADGAPSSTTGPAAPRAIPEGAEVILRDRKAALVRVQWGMLEGYVSSSQVRALAK
jgi:hypothetical protein